jgi:hypothetical protein
MAQYTSAQIITPACQIAKVPGYTSLAGQLLNTILEELWQVYDFAFSRLKTFIDLTQAQPLDAFQQPLGYLLPTNHERTLEVYYVVNGAPRMVTQLPIEQYDTLFQSNVGSSYAEFFCIDVSQTPHRMLVYPTPPLAVGVYVRYLPQQSPITTPETSSTVPWFPNQLYLITRLSAELMMVSDDNRRDKFLEDAAGILSKYLTNGDDDREGYVRQVKLDPRYFRTGYSDKATKQMPL